MVPTMLKCQLRTRLVAYSICLALCFSFGSVKAGISYGDPDGGWAYTYEGAEVDNDQGAALDGDWTFGGGSDSWDGSAIGEGAPGGVSALKDGDTTFIRIQDTGDPRDHVEYIEDNLPNHDAPAGDPSNRKIYFDRDIVALDDIQEEFLEEGFTFSFRARIATAATGPVDPWLPDGGGPEEDWPADGLGEHVIEFDSTAHISFFQPGNVGSLGFALTTEEGPAGVGENGLLMNDLSDDFACQNCGDTGNGDLNHLGIQNINEWQEFWVTIEASPDGPGTHKVNVYTNGSTDANEFDVTAGVRKDGGGIGPLSIGIPGTTKASAWDLDFISIGNGVIAPVPGGGGLEGDFDMSGVLDLADVNMLIGQINGDMDSAFDLNSDAAVDDKDLTIWVKDLRKTWVGDADLDGEFNSGDLVNVFQEGKFETGQPATWDFGDWDGNGVFDSGDFVAAFQDGGFERGPLVPAAQSVPEPSCIVMLLLGIAVVGLHGRRAE